ncbi:MAG: HlyC/CorC family transporter [Candidatus Marinimicrobia bacterium]|nr:HlyC/CorC family transporter [Candidatus Neomarinimicrobiota bacterium]
MSTITTILIILICVLGEAFFSGSEIAIISVDKLRLKHSAKAGHRPSRLALEMLKKPEWILGTTLLGTNIFTITSTTLISSQLYILLGPAGIPIAIAIMAFTNWIFAEIVPKSVFQQLTNSLTPRIAYILRGFSLLFLPLIWLFSKTAGLLASLFGGAKADSKIPFISKEELKILMKMTTDKGDVKPSERKMINRLLTFTETEAQDIMLPLIDVAALSDKTFVKEAIQQFVQTKHRRLPIYSNRIDKIIGILNSFDILDENKNKKIKPFIRAAFYIPPTMSVSVLLEQLQSTGNNMAIVVDEFGGAEGIITIEDILEEVVGEIEDEYDKVKPLYQIQKEGSIIINGRMEVDDINERFELDIPEGDYESIGGFIINTLKKIPRPGESIKLPKVILTVQKATSRVVIEIKIQKVQSQN